MARTIAITAAFFMLTAGSAFAAGIANTVHNLSTTGPVGFVLNSQNETEICIFCHTPHAGDLTAPLWNKNAPTGGGANYLHYNSATLNGTIKADHLAQNIYDESLMCLACHDGSVSMYTVLNTSASTGGQPQPPVTNPSGKMFAPVGNALIGKGPAGNGMNDLTDDHPISFKYFPVQNDGTNATPLHTVAAAEAAGVAFFPLNGLEAEKRVECASCHDPHVDYTASGDTTLAPFLRTANTASALCLACHDM